MTAARDEARRNAESGDVFDALTSATREADELFESGKTGGGGTRHWLRDCLLPALDERGLLVVRVSEVVQLQQERDQLAEAVKDQGVDPVDYILTRPSWEERREAAKCLFAASVMADGYGKPETAAKFRAAAENLKTGDLAALAASRRAGG